MSNFIKEFIEKICEDLDLLREENRFNYNYRYDIFVAFYILGIFDSKKFVANVEGKSDINLDVVNKVRIFNREFESQFDFVVENDISNEIKDVLKEYALKVYYQGFIQYLNIDSDTTQKRIKDVLNNHFNICNDDSLDLINSSIHKVIKELIFRHIIIDINDFESKVR